MSEPNDKGLEDYLRRESAVSQRYRELEADDVPPQLDAAVIARARAAIEPNVVGPNRRKPAWMKWGAPLALAASAVMVVAIVLEVGVQEEVRAPAPQVEVMTRAAPAPEAVAMPNVVQEAPVAAPMAPSAGIAPMEQSAAPKIITEGARADNAASAEARRQRKAVESRAVAATAIEREATDETVVTASQPPSAAEQVSRSLAPAPSADLSGATVESAQFASGDLDSLPKREQVTNVPAGAARSTALTRTSAPVSPAPQVPATQAPRLPPEAWLEQIRTLRREGKVIEADQQWREFRELYPQFVVSETDAARPKP